MSSHHSARQRGASTAEYGLLAVGIAATVALAVYALGAATRDQTSEACTTITGEIQGALASADPAADCGP